MPSRLFLKARISGYTKKDGTFVKPHDDKRITAPLFGLNAFKWLLGFREKAEEGPPPGAVKHPKSPDDKAVWIHTPHTPSDALAWGDPSAEVIVTPGSPVPSALHGVALEPWKDVPTSLEEWADVEGQIDMEEGELVVTVGKKPASGVVIVEDDGRVWLVSPSNGFGYKNTFPKGKLDDGLSLQANAIKEAYEESGLQVQIVDMLGDVERMTSVTRYYLARRVGGSPAEMGWESQAVRLAPQLKLEELLMSVDMKLLKWMTH